VAATEQLTAAEGRLTAMGARADQREQEFQAALSSREAQVRALETALGQARSALASAVGQYELVAQIIAKLTASASASAAEPADRSRRRVPRKKGVPA